MITRSTFRWVGRVDAEDGLATFFPDTTREVTVRMERFSDANNLAMAINGEVKDTAKNARRSLAKQIAELA